VVLKSSVSGLLSFEGSKMQRPNCTVCGLPVDESGGNCPHCGNKPLIGPKTQESRKSESGETDFTKYLAVGVFTGALIAASLVLFLVFSSGNTQKGADIAPSQETLIQSPTNTVPATSASPQDEPADDRRSAAGSVHRSPRKSPPTAGDDGKRKRQDIIETPGKNPKMTQY
jgi:hypothetical protein